MARLRIFAGPNGSGKTTLNAYVRGEVNLGIYLNPDDMLAQISRDGHLDLAQYGVAADQGTWDAFFLQHGLHDHDGQPGCPSVRANVFSFPVPPNAYLISILADFVRHLLLEQKVTFSFETVFSHPSKLELIKIANDKGYRTYLYFICTSDPQINVMRVKQRLKEGGHDVPEAKIRDRYQRALRNLKPAIDLSYRTFLFDNSGRESRLVAEVTPDKFLHLKTNHIPQWVKTFVVPE